MGAVERHTDKHIFGHRVEDRCVGVIGYGDDLEGVIENEMNARYEVGACIYGFSMITFYCLSTLYHSVRRPYVRYLFRILDHASIYLMIAGSYTPFGLVTLRGPWGWTLLGVVWGLGTIGAGLKVFTTHRLPYLGPLLYIALGWVVVIAYRPLSAALAPNGVYLLFAGGVAYTLGVAFYLWDRLPYNHAIWHLFVLTGSACHFFAVYYYVTPRSS